MKKLLCLSNANNAMLLKIPKQAGIITSILLAFSPVMSANGNPVAEPEIVVQVSQQSSTVKGVVEDDMGPVVGATVVVKGTTNGTVTDMDGNFSLPGVKEGSILVVSYVGYLSQEITYTGQSSLRIQLKEDSKQLDEVVVVGYGSQKKVNLTGSVSTVDSKVLESRPVQNVSQALQGVIPGLNMSVGSSGGTLDSQLNINIRGGGTIGQGSSGSPLVLIDGIEGNMNTVNPNDIENISVLKDAASSSIYGARASFGVILITTKSGKAGKTRVNYSGNVRFSDAVQVPDMVDSYSFAQYFNRASTNGGGNPIFNDDAMKNIKDYMDGKFTDPTKPEYYGTVAGADGKWQNYGGAFANTDWFSEFYRDWVPSTEHNLSLSGGTDKLTYMLSGSFLDQTGLLKHGDDKFNRYTMNAKISAKLADWVTVNYTGKWTREDYHRPTYLTGLFFHNIARRCRPARLSIRTGIISGIWKLSSWKTEESKPARRTGTPSSCRLFSNLLKTGVSLLKAVCVLTTVNRAGRYCQFMRTMPKMNRIFFPGTVVQPATRKYRIHVRMKTTSLPIFIRIIPNRWAIITLK